MAEKIEVPISELNKPEPKIISELDKLAKEIKEITDDGGVVAGVVFERSYFRDKMIPCLLGHPLDDTGIVGWESGTIVNVKYTCVTGMDEPYLIMTV